MIRSTRIAALAGLALALSTVPTFAQDLVLPGLGLDLDPFHIFTPAPPPAAAPAPAAEHHRHAHHHHARHHHTYHRVPKH